VERSTWNNLTHYEACKTEVERIARNRRRQVGLDGEVWTQEIVDDALEQMRHMRFEDPKRYLMMYSIVARNRLVTQIRHDMTQKRGGGMRAVPLHEGMSCEASPENLELIVEVDAVMRRLLADEKWRIPAMALHLQYWGENSLETIAATLDLTVPQVKWALDKVRRKMREALGGRVHDETQ